MNSRALLWFLVFVIIVLVALGLYAIYPKSLPAAIPTTVGATTTQAVIVATSAPAPTLDRAIVAQNVVGNWQSIYDSNYTVQITSGGKWTDTYKGNDKSSATLEGAYTLFTNTDPDKNFTGTLTPGVVYLKVVEGSSTLYYDVLTASGNELQLSYLATGSTLSFVRVQ